MVEVLCEASVRATSRDPEEARSLARSACELAYDLFEEPPAWAGRRWAAQLACFAFAHLGNALRVGDDLPASEEVFSEVERSWEEAGLHDVLGYRTRILDLLASLRRAQRRLPEGARTLSQVIDHHRVRDPHRAARAMVNKAKALEEMDLTAEALSLIEEASTLLDARREPELARTLLHNRTYYLAALGRADEAAALLPRVREAFRSEPGSLDAIRVDWIEARIAEGLGDRPQARWLLEKVRNRFARAGLAFDAALAALELACLAAEDGDAPEVRRIARTLIPVFEGQQVHREALAALRLFHYGALEERIDQHLVRSVYDYLRKARHDPDLKFPGGRPSARPDPEAPEES